MPLRVLPSVVPSPVKNFLGRIRVRVLWVSVGVVATSLGVIVLTAVPAWPVVATAIAGWALVVNTLARNWAPDRCHACGTDIAASPTGSHGRICPDCGAVNEVIAGADPSALTLPEPLPEDEQA